MNLTILDPDEIKTINAVMDYILKNPSKTVGTIKRRFGLSEEEYRMIFDLTMPHIRTDNAKSYWKTKYLMLRGQISEFVQNNKSQNSHRNCGVFWKTAMSVIIICWLSRKQRKKN